MRFQDRSGRVVALGPISTELRALATTGDVLRGVLAGRSVAARMPCAELGGGGYSEFPVRAGRLPCASAWAGAGAGVRRLIYYSVVNLKDAGVLIFRLSEN